MFFSDCFKQYLKEAFLLLKPATKQAYEARFSYFTKRSLSKINMEYLNTKYIHTWINWLKKHHTSKNKRRKTFRHELQLLSAILNWYRNFVDEDFNIPITKQNRSNPVYWRLAAFMVLTGARVGEACGMLWSAVDLEQGKARVIRKIKWDRKTKRPSLEEDTKTSASVRLLILSDELIEILKQMKEKNGDEGLLFTDKKEEALKYNVIQCVIDIKK